MNILIIGLGSIARKHISAIRSVVKNSDIYALRSSMNAEKIEGITNLFDLKDNTIKFDFAIISNPTQLHYKFIEELSSHNLNLFIEKPPVHSLEEIDSLIDKVNKQGIKTYVACNLRFHPCIAYLKDILNKKLEKRINEVNIYCGSFLPDWRPNKDFRKIYSVNPEMGGGVHLDLFHEIDYAHWLFGTPIKVHCLKRNVSTIDIKAVDYANYILEYKNFTANIVLNYYRRDAKRSLEIVFDDETWTIDLIKNNIITSTNEIIFNASDFSILETYESQMKYFINCLKTNKKQMNNFIESIEILKICLINE